MPNSERMMCDGCGQLADAEHIERRLRRLEWATRYRPVHIQALILGGVAPQIETEYLYAPETAFEGDAGNILRVAGITPEGRAHEALLTEFQKLGLMLAYVLECPLNDDIRPEHSQGLLDSHLPTTVSRIRRSLRPQRVVLFSTELAGVAELLRRAELGGVVLPAKGRPFLASPDQSAEELRSFREALAGA